MKGSVYKRGEIYWVTWSEDVKSPDGKVRRKKFYESSRSTRKGDATTLLNTRIFESSRRGPRAARDLTYEDCRDRWLSHRASKSKPHTLKSGETYFAGHRDLNAFFKGWKAAAIDTEDIEKFQGILRDRGLGNGIDRAVASLRSMLRFSALHTKDGLRVDQLPRRFPMVRNERAEPKLIPEQLFYAIRAALPEPWRTPFVLLWHTGMRVSEVERLVWAHVDLPNARLRFPSAKTRRVRSVPLLADTAELLAKIPRGAPSDLVFKGFASDNVRLLAWRKAAVIAGAGKWVCPKCRKDLVNAKCEYHGQFGPKRAGYDGVMMRTTRHGAIRRLTNRGVPTARILQMMGHQKVDTHMGYNLASDEEDLALIRKAYEGAGKT